MDDILCTDGTRLCVNQWLPENGKSLGIVVIVHGMGEYGERYAPFAKWLTSHGMAVYAPDLRGHGRTAEVNEAIEGHFADQDGWNLVVNDIHQLIEQIRLEHPGMSIFMFGHSMGSLLARTYSQLYGSNIDGVIHSAASGPMGGLARFGYIFAKIEALLIGLRGYSTRMSILLTGNFNRRISPVRTPFDWISRDEKEVDLYLADKRIVKKFSAAFYRDMIGGAIQINLIPNMRRTPSVLPMLFISGSEDPLGDYCKGVTKTFNLYKKFGSSDIELIVYPEARHELFQEHNRAKVMVDVWDWISKRILDIEYVK